MKARLTRIKAGYERHALRTDALEGDTHGPPRIGSRFEIWNDKPIDMGTHRFVSTSGVTAFDEQTGEFTTQSGSQYLFEALT